MTTTADLARRVGLALQAGDRGGFVAAMHGLLQARPALGERWRALAMPLADYGEATMARAAMALFVKAAGYGPAALFDQAMLLARLGRADEAAALLPKIGRRVPDAASNAYFRGTLALNMGDLAQARAELLTAADAAPRSGQILRELASLGSLATDGAVADRILASGPAMAGVAGAERAAYLYALGKLHHDRGAADPAFAAYAEGAAIVARQRPYRAAEDRQGAAVAVSGWSAASVAEVGGRVTRDTGRPIIVTGLPRSGTTLVEQILVSHSRVSEGDEIGRFALVAAEIGGVDAASASRWLTRHDADTASGLYLHLIEERFGAGGHIVDKTLDASRYLGLLAALLPGAPVLWVRRDPLDTAWSCLRTWFAVGVDWSWSQAAIAAHFRLEDELLARWQDVLGDRLMVVDYGALVADTAATVPPMLAHCGLPMEAQVLSPEKTRRLVTTNSAAQVRAPITTAAVDSAAPYAGHLRPFIDAYGAT